MKDLIKKISLFLVVIMVLAISFGCTPKEKPVDPDVPGNIVDNEDPDDEDDPVVEEPKAISIQATDKADVENLALLDSYIVDIDNDGNEETISMYVNAHQEPNGEIYWDDGQEWLFVVQGMEKDYILFDDYVQLGTIRFHVYNDLDDNNFYITTIKSTTASLTVTEHRFDKETDSFIAKVVYNTTGNVNMLHSTYGY